MNACRLCGSPIRWARTEHGKRIPLDAEPYTGDDTRGLFVLREGGELALAVPAGAFDDEPRYRSHFATCPHADKHRRS